MPATSPENVLRELWVNIKADISDLRRGFSQGATETRTFIGRMGAASKELEKVGKAVTLVSGALVGVGLIATKTFADFEQSMANTQSVLGATTEELETLTDFAREMGKTTVFTASQAADAMYYLAQAGFDTNQTMGALEGTLALATATASGLAETTSVIVSTLNQFQLAADQSTRLANIFAASIASSLSSMEKLRDSLKFVGPVAYQAGESVESTVAALSKLFNAGLTASIAGTQLRQVFLRLIKPTKDAYDALADLGINAEEVNPQVKSLTEIIRRFQEAIPPDRLRRASDELARIFGIRAVTAFNVLLTEGADSLEEFQERITGTDKAAQQAATQIDTLRGAWRLLISALQESAIIIGNILEPVVREIIDTTRDFVQIFNNLPPIFQKVLVIVPALAGALGLVVGPLTLLASQIPKIIAGFGALQVAFGAAAGPIGLVVAGLTALGGALFYLAGAERRRHEEVEQAIRLSRERVDSILKEKENIQSLTGEFISLDRSQGGVNKLTDRQKTIIDEINSVYPNLIRNTGDYSEALIDVLNASAEATEEVQKLTQAQVDLARADLTLQLVDLRNRYIELKDEISGGPGLFDFGTVINIKPIKDELDGILATSDIINEIFQEQEPRRKARGFIKIGDELERAATEAFRFGDIISDLSNVSTLLASKQAEANELRAKGMESEVELNDFQKDRLKQLDLEIDSLTKLRGVFADAVKETAEFSKVTEQMKEVETALQNIQKFGEQPPTGLSAEELQNIANQEVDIAMAKEEAITEDKRYQQNVRYLDEEVAAQQMLEVEKILDGALEEIEKDRMKRREEETRESIRLAREEARERRRQARETANFISDVATVMGTAIGKSAMKISDAWKSALKDLVDLIAGVYKKMLEATIAAALYSLPPNYLAAARAAVGITLISAAQAVAHSLIDQAAVGAEVERTGIVKVHAGETIVPASVARATRDEYRGKLLGVEGGDDEEDPGAMQTGSSKRGMVINEIHLHNPMVDDPRFWRSVLDNTLEETQLYREKRFNRR